MSSEDKKARALLEQERQKLALWMMEWQFDQWLDETAAGGFDDPDVEGQQAVRVSSPYLKSDLKDGDIRLMAPVDRTQPPLYALLLADRAHPGFEWIPFSRFAHPALPTEWLTGLRMPSLRVLSIWNAHSSSRDIAPSSWRVKRLPLRQLENWRRTVMAIRAGQEVDASVLRRTGPRLLHPADPRHLYIAGERDRWGAFWKRGGASTILFREGDRGSCLAEHERDMSGLLLAAESGGDYGISRWRYRTQTPYGVVNVECERMSERDWVSLRIVDVLGVCIEHFDGGYVETTDGIRSTPIQAAWSSIQVTTGSRLMTLIDVTGDRYDLKEVRQE